jgi:hypothetical protein
MSGRLIGARAAGDAKLALGEDLDSAELDVVRGGDTSDLG